MATFDANARAVVQNVLAPKVADQVIDNSPLTMELLSNVKKFKGQKMNKTFKFQKQSNGKSFSGFDRFNTTKSDTKRKLEFDPRGYTMPVVIEGMERDATASDPSASIDLKAEAMENAAVDMADDVSDILYLDGTGNSNKDFQGLAAIVDDGGEVANYGGQSRSTYTTLQANEYDLSGDITLDQLATAESAATFGSDMVTLHVTTKAVWNQFEKLHQAFITGNQAFDGYAQMTRNGIQKGRDGLAGEAGFNALFYRGAPVVADPHCTANKWFGLNMDHLAFYALKSTDPNYKSIKVGGTKQIDGVYSDMPAKDTGFYFSGLMNPIDQYGEIGHIILLGNLISFKPNRHFTINLT